MPFRKIFRVLLEKEAIERKTLVIFFVDFDKIFIYDAPFVSNREYHRQRIKERKRYVQSRVENLTLSIYNSLYLHE